VRANTDVRGLQEWGLVVMDMQNDFLAAGGYYARRSDMDKQVEQGKLTLEARNRLLSQPSVTPPETFSYRARSLRSVATNVCTIINHARTNQRPIAYLKAVYSREFDVQPSFLTREPHREHYPCKPHSWGAALIEPITQLIATNHVDSSEKVIEKHTFDGFFQTELLQLLQTWKVETVVIVGVETHVCVLATAKSASIHQFKTLILEDCTWTAQEELGQGALAIFRDAFGSTARLQEILGA
jgi:nicotinamidase-related amidase